MESVVRARQSLLLVGLLLAFSPSLLMAVVTGSISGTVRDSSGAVIPDVSVEARNTNTGVAQTIQSDSVGFYNFPALAVGQYDVSFQKSGFVTYRQTGLPPGPIANPGKAAIQACVSPQQRDRNYLFYFADCSGHTHFAKSEAEFESQIRQYGVVGNGC